MPEKVVVAEKPKEKKKRIPSTDLPKPDKKKPKEGGGVSFSKVKKADSKSEESASLLRLGSNEIFGKLYFLIYFSFEY